MKKSIVKNVQGNGTWEGKFGLMYKFEVEMENGDSGEYSSKSKEQTKFVVGEEVEYEFIDGNFPKIKPVNTFNNSGGGASYSNKNDDIQKMIVRQSSLNRAADICIAQGIYTTEDIISRAEIFVDWVLNSKKEKSEYPF